MTDPEVSSRFSSGRSNGLGFVSPALHADGSWGEPSAVPYITDLPNTKLDPRSGLATPLIESTRYEDSDVEKGGGSLKGGIALQSLAEEKGFIPASRGAQEFGRKTNASKDVMEHVKAVIEQNEGLKQPFVVRNLFWTYMVTVLVVVLLSIGGQIAVQIEVSTSYSDARVVNVAGRQRMLSQLLTKDALVIAMKRQNGGNVTYYVKEMGEKLELFKESHFGLLYGNKSMKLPKTKRKKIKAMFRELNPHFDAIYGNVSEILTLNPETVQAGSEAFSKLKTDTQYILDNEGLFWKLQNKITDEYQSVAQGHSNVVLILTWVLHSLVVVTLLLEGLFVFRPILRHVQSLINERFSLLRRSLESEAESRGVSVLMMGYISHELRQPLSALLQHIQMASDILVPLASSVAPPPEKATSSARSTLQELEKSLVCCSLMNTVVGDISNLRNIELGRMTLAVELVDISEVVQQVVNVLAPKVPEGVNLRMDVDSEIESQARQLDKHRLQQVVLNLVDNAFQRTQSGDVVVRVKRGREAHLLRFEIEDTGSAMSGEERRKLFEPIMDSSGPRDGEGSSLSLYVVKLLVELQGGKWGIESEEGSGTVVWVELPAAAGAKEAVLGASRFGAMNPSSASIMPLESAEYSNSNEFQAPSSPAKAAEMAPLQTTLDDANSSSSGYREPPRHSGF